MRTFLLTSLAVVVIAFTGGQALAQQKIAPDKEALIKELLQVTGSTKSMTDVSDMMMTYQKAEAEKLIESMIDGENDFTPVERAEIKRSTKETIDRMTSRLNEFFTKELDLAKVMDEIAVPMYDRNFTETELRELIAFYKTSTGQKTVSVMPKLVMETMAGFSEKVMPKLQEFLKKITDEELAQLKQKVEQNHKNPPKPKAKS